MTIRMGGPKSPATFILSVVRACHLSNNFVHQVETSNATSVMKLWTARPHNLPVMWPSSAGSPNLLSLTVVHYYLWKQNQCKNYSLRVSWNSEIFIRIFREIRNICSPSTYGCGVLMSSYLYCITHIVHFFMCAFQKMWINLEGSVPTSL